MIYERRIIEYVVDDIFKVSIYRSLTTKVYRIVIISTESGQIEQYRNIESVPTFDMIDKFINKDFHYGFKSTLQH